MLKMNPVSLDWQVINQRKLDSAVAAEFVFEVYHQHVGTINPVRFRNVVATYSHENFVSYAPRHEWERVAESFGSRLLQGEEGLAEKLRNYAGLKKPTLNKVLRELESQNVALMSPTRLANYLFRLHYAALSEIYAINLVQVEQALEWAINERCHGNKALQEAALRSMHPGQRTVAFREELQALTLSLEVSKGHQTMAEAQRSYLAEFEGVASGYGDTGESIIGSSQRLAKLSEISPEVRECRLTELTSLRAPEIGHLPKDLSQLCDLAGEIALLRDRNKALMGKVSKYRSLILTAVASLLQLPGHDLSVYLLEEILDLLNDSGRILSQGEVERRKEIMVFERRENCWTEMLSTDSARRDLMFNEAVADYSSLSGVSAALGCAVGKVRKVYSAQDAAGVTGEDVMVAMGTDLHLLAGLRNCAAVITEESGILSHAAIVAREYGKPCVVGVRSAMRLPDGILVKVEPPKVSLLDEIELAQSVVSLPNADGVYTLADPNSRHAIGNKAYYLAQAKSQGFNVKDGVIVTPQFHGHVLELSKTIVGYFRDTGCDELIVRSSSVMEDGFRESKAGSFISRTVSTSPWDVAETIRHVRMAHPLQDGSGISTIPILIQPYVTQVLGGVGFTHHPTNEDSGILIEFHQTAALVVNGHVLGSRTFLPSEIPTGSWAQGTTLDEVLSGVALMIDRLEKFFGFPIDVEWGATSSEIVLFQVRPITHTVRREQHGH